MLNTAENIQEPVVLVECRYERRFFRRVPASLLFGRIRNVVLLQSMDHLVMHMLAEHSKSLCKQVACKFCLRLNV